MGLTAAASVPLSVHTHKYTQSLCMCTKNKRESLRIHGQCTERDKSYVVASILCCLLWWMLAQPRVFNIAAILLPDGVCGSSLSSPCSWRWYAKRLAQFPRVVTMAISTDVCQWPWWQMMCWLDVSFFFVCFFSFGGVCVMELRCTRCIQPTLIQNSAWLCLIFLFYFLKKEGRIQARVKILFVP